MAILEKMLLKNVPEGMEYKFKSSQIQLEIQTFSSYKVHEKEFAEFTDDNTGSVVKFPIRDAKKVGDRVSVSVISYSGNPFFGSRYTGASLEYSIVGN